MSASLILAVPSKGRLQEAVGAYFADAGAAITRPRGARDYTGGIAGAPGIEVVFLSASEIAGALVSGAVHLGVTGEDLLRDAAPAHDDRVGLITALGFGFADVVVAVPTAWLDVATMADLDDVATAFHARHARRLRVATKYLNLTRDFFAGHGIADYRIVESLGATEGAPAAGTAEIIVDITTTGATLAANNLKVLDDGVILRSEAQLAGSKRAAWTPGAREAAEGLLERLAARALAKTMDVIRVRIEQGADAAVGALVNRLGCRPVSRPASGNAAGEHAILCPRTRVHEAVALLREAGVDAVVSVKAADFVYAPGNGLTAALHALAG